MTRRDQQRRCKRKTHRLVSARASFLDDGTDARRWFGPSTTGLRGALDEQVVSVLDTLT